MLIFIYIIWVVGWFQLCLSAGYVFVSMLREKNTHIEFLAPITLIVVGIPVYLTGSYIRTHVESPNLLIFWIPAILGTLCGFIAGYGNEDNNQHYL